MDKNSIIGFVLIGLILVAWLYFVNKNSQVDKLQKEQQTQQTLIRLAEAIWATRSVALSGDGLA